MENYREKVKYRSERMLRSEKARDKRNKRTNNEDECYENFLREMRKHGR